MVITEFSSSWGNLGSVRVVVRPLFSGFSMAVHLTDNVVKAAKVRHKNVVSRYGR